MLYDYKNTVSVNDTGVIGNNIGFTDLLSIVLDSPYELNSNAQVSDILSRLTIPAADFNFNVEQESTAEERFAGEGADPNTFLIHNAVYRANIKMPIIIPATGWVDPTFAYIWQLAKNAYWGSKIPIVTKLLSDATSPVSRLKVSGISDFVDLQAPFAIKITPPPGNKTETSEIIIINAADKRNKELILLNQNVNAHSIGSIIQCVPLYYNGPNIEPSFSLFSLREGLLSPCFVNKIDIDLKPNETIYANIEIIILGVQRNKQPQLRIEQKRIINDKRYGPVCRMLEGHMVYISPLNGNSGDFNLASPIGSPLFGGYQGLKLPYIYVTGSKITIDNRLQVIHTLHSLNEDNKILQRENSNPWAVYSEGRIISGDISYNAPVTPTQVCERLSGPSSINSGGLSINFRTFKFDIPEVVWTPSKSEGNAKSNQSRTIEWNMMAETYDAMPQIDILQQGL